MCFNNILEKKIERINYLFIELETSITTNHVKIDRTEMNY